MSPLRACSNGRSWTPARRSRRRPRGRLVAATSLVVCASVAAVLPASATDTSLDPSFGDTGKSLFLDDAAVAELHVDGNSVLALGYEVARNKLFVARLDDVGQLVPGFGNQGVKHIQIGRDTSQDAFLNPGLSVDASGRILIVAQSSKEITVVRLTADGALDTSFSQDGRKTLPGRARVLDSNPVVLTDSDARIMVGAMVRLAGGPSDLHVWRLLDAGTPDVSWSGDGMRTVDRANVEWFDAMTVDAHDRVLIASSPSVALAAHVYRLRPNGTWDTAFGDNGDVRFRLKRRAPTYAFALAVTEGEITVAAASPTDNLFGAVRLRPSGEFDRSYGDAGVISINCTRGCDPNSGAVDRGIVVIGLDAITYDGSAMRVARISRDGTGIRQMAVHPIVKVGTLAAVGIDGQRTLLGGYDGSRGAYLARIE